MTIREGEMPIQEVSIKDSMSATDYVVTVVDEQLSLVPKSIFGEATVAPNIVVDTLGFNTNYVKTGNEAVSTCMWNAVDGTVDMVLLNGSILQIGLEIFIYGKALGNILNGDVLQFAGVQGNHILMKKAVQSEINDNPALIIGIATNDIANNNYGYCTWFGKINGVFTTGLSLADIIYYDSSSTAAGAWTKTPPAAPNRKIMMATVIKLATGAAENGVIMVRPTWGQKLSDLDDVDGTATTILDTELILKKESSGIWKHITFSNLVSCISNALSSIFVPKTRTITINGTEQDLSADRSYEVVADVLADDIYVEKNTEGEITISQKTLNLIYAGL